MAKAKLTPGQRLSARLNKLRLTQLEFASAIGASPSLVCRWISGERVPRLDMAVAIARSAVRIPADAWVRSSDASG